MEKQGIKIFVLVDDVQKSFTLSNAVNIIQNIY